MQGNRGYPESYYAGDEIDLLDLFAIVWEGKWLLAGVTGLCAVAAFLILSATPSQYSVESVVRGPSPHRIQLLQPSRLEEPRKPEQRDERSDDPESQEYEYESVYQVSALEPNDVYATVLAYASSLHVQEKFWLEGGGESLVLPDGGSEEETEAAFRSFVKNLEITKPDEMDSPGAFSHLTYTTEFPAKGVTLLEEYIQFLDDYAARRYVGQLQSAYRTNLARLKDDYRALVQRERANLEHELIRLEEAHQMAESLGIADTPYERVANVQLSILDNRQYLLGASALTREIAALKARQNKPLEPFVPELRAMGAWRSQMERDLRRLDGAADNVDTLVVLSPPTSSLQPVKPNKPLIFVAVVFGAGMLGLLLVFVRHGIRSYRAREASETEVA